jgi:hypothetical protein
VPLPEQKEQLQQQPQPSHKREEEDVAPPTQSRTHEQPQAVRLQNHPAASPDIPAAALSSIAHTAQEQLHHRHHSAAAPHLPTPPAAVQAPMQPLGPTVPLVTTSSTTGSIVSGSGAGGDRGGGGGRAGTSSVIAAGGSNTAFGPGIVPLGDLEALRAQLSRELDHAREENRALYIHSARRMIQLQEKIDALTAQNVQLIRALKPQQW